MAISYPVAMPNPGRFAKIQITPQSVVSMNPSIFSGQQQIYVFSGQWWELLITLPAMPRTVASLWIAWLCSLNGREGTFTCGDSVGPLPQGTIGGAPTIGTGVVTGTTTLPIAGGTGAFALGDWLQISTSLYNVVQVNSGSVDVFPKLRPSAVFGASIIYNNPVGQFRLKAPVPFTANEKRIYDGFVIDCQEAI